MTNPIAPTKNERLTSVLRLIGWTAVAGLLITPAIAMRFSDEVQWTTSDFVFAGSVLIGAGGIAELAVRASDAWSYRFGAGLALLASVGIDELVKAWSHGTLLAERAFAVVLFLRRFTKPRLVIVVKM